MGGFFGTVSSVPCVDDLFYGTDYCSHLGTRRAGMATFSKESGFMRSIHSLESNYFRTKFEPELGKFVGKIVFQSVKKRFVRHGLRRQLGKLRRLAPFGNKDFNRSAENTGGSKAEKKSRKTHGAQDICDFFAHNHFPQNLK